MFLGLMALAAAAKVIHFAVVPQGTLKICEERLACSKTTSCESATGSGEGHHDRWLPACIFDALEVGLAARGIGWKFAEGIYIPRPRRPSERSAYLKRTSISVLRTYLLVDFFDSFLETLPGITVDSGTIFIPTLPMMARYLVSTALHLGTGIVVILGLEMWYDIASLVGPWHMKSLHEFWSQQWHQLLRDTFLVMGGYPGRWIAGDLGLLFGTFLASGLFHEIGLYLGGAPIGPRVLIFFVAQAFGILTEKLYKSHTGKRHTINLLFFGHFVSALFARALHWDQSNLAKSLGHVRGSFLLLRAYEHLAVIQHRSLLFRQQDVYTRASRNAERCATSRSPTTTPFNVGPWRVQSATHKVTGKRVSVWSADKRSPDMERMGPASKERTLEVLKAEASALSRLRHPSVLEMVEPLEETRNELIFATEPILSSLQLSIPGSLQYAPLVELDEVEIQKGILQLCKGLSFLHTSARLIHSNINPESVVINSSGDWKLSGLGLTIPLSKADGGPTRWEFPTFDGRALSYTQRSFDYIAPEYALDEVLDPASDMYSLGCLIYAPELLTHERRQAIDGHGALGPGPERQVPALLNALITRQPHSRPSPSDLPLHPFFSSLPVSTLNFLDRSNFAAKTREEKISFMKGLTSVLDRFTEGLRTRKILPSLLEEMKDTHLLPYILPNIFAISQILSSTQFATLVLPSLKPLFAIKEPPQNMLTLLDNLQMLQEKTEKPVFREHVLPLVYNALESEHAIVQERALKTVPNLCETIDYAEVQGVLFPRVALVFTKTRILSVKVATLETFLSMVKTLDQSSLTQKLVPLLSKIRTKEPAVTMATLNVQEAMGMKVDREAVATLVLPQLWAMSMGPLLTVNQFKRFMEVIKKLGDRVEKEHDQYLRDSQRVEDRSTTVTNGMAMSTTSAGGAVDFESLVAGGSGPAAKAETTTTGTSSWEDDVWGSILTSGPSVGNSHSYAP
ncbi:hypothetical protein ONZ51_g13269 [Trametes cubensis]|uniref:Protein kinase domain-containing protein n=1 Tax=Trametes cubensis TaxID=1111947 RepID=A0AAD7TGV7_9APHY|nr:hypothetical protein ONZ51_g13269 [Trametes cubensis]